MSWRALSVELVNDGPVPEVCARTYRPGTMPPSIRMRSPSRQDHERDGRGGNKITLHEDGVAGSHKAL